MHSHRALFILEPLPRTIGIGRLNLHVWVRFVVSPSVRRRTTVPIVCMYGRYYTYMHTLDIMSCVHECQQREASPHPDKITIDGRTGREGEGNVM
jgi:hypothetical protein